MVGGGARAKNERLLNMFGCRPYKEMDETGPEHTVEVCPVTQSSQQGFQF